MPSTTLDFESHSSLQHDYNLQSILPSILLFKRRLNYLAIAPTQQFKLRERDTTNPNHRIPPNIELDGRVFSLQLENCAPRNGYLPLGESFPIDSAKTTNHKKEHLHTSSAAKEFDTNTLMNIPTDRKILVSKRLKVISLMGMLHSESYTLFWPIFMVYVHVQTYKYKCLETTLEMNHIA